MQQTRHQHRVPCRRLCALAAAPYSTVMRWQARVARGEPATRRRGPKKVQFDFSALEEQVRSLPHGQRRTAGFGQLYEQCREAVSRRALGRMVAAARLEWRRQRRHGLRRVKWREPGLAWSMDDAFLGRDGQGRKTWFHLVQDLASQHKFRELIVGDQPGGDEVARHPRRLFDRYGAPLILKEDNGKNLNAAAVKRVLDEYGVIRLTSPPYYPPYNGAVEHGIGEVKSAVRERLADRQPVPRQHLAAYGEAAVNDVNHKERRQLQQQTSCQAFGNRRKRVTFTRRKRKEIHREIIAVMAAELENTNDHTDADRAAAWRVAVEAVLQRRGLISVSTGQRVLPYLPTQNVS